MLPQHRTKLLPRALTLLLALPLATAACSGGDGDDDGKADSGKDGKTTATTSAPKGSLDLEVGASTVASAGAEVVLDPAVAKNVVAVVDDYVDAAVVDALLTGKQSKDLEKLFGLRVVTRVMPDGDDRGALTDEGLPRVTADLKAKAKPVALDALAGPDGAIVMIGATLSLEVHTETADGPLRIRRVGTLILEPAPEGAWQITGYDMEVKRTSAGATSTDSATTTTEAP